MTAESSSKVKLGYREYTCFPDDGRRHEILDGEHFVNPAPETYHQTLSRRIQFQLYQQIELPGHGQVYNAPTDVQLSEHDICQPDLILVLAAKRTIITPTKIKGTPDLLVEILSPSSAKTDRELKKELYRRAGVPEYWIVDPEEHVVEQYLLAAGDYVLGGGHTESVELQVISDVRVDLGQVW